MTAVHQFVPSYTAYSWAGVHAGNVADVLEDLGIESRIYVAEARGVDRTTLPWRSFTREAARDKTWLLYQLSTGDLMADMLAARPEPKIVNYHNVSPADIWAPWEPLRAPELVEGRHQLGRLAAGTELAIADSTYNQGELIDAGYRHAEVCPILADYDDLGAVSEPRVERELRATKEGADWMFVGRVSPHKCQHHVIEAFAFYRRVFDPHARLWFVGGSSSHRYLTTLEKMVHDLGIDGCVSMLGTAPQDVITAHHRVADVVVSLSDHEGFGIPLVEAMWHRIPIVAYAGTAVTETVGPAGLLLTDKAPAVVATAVHRVVTDRTLRDALVERGAKQYERFSLKRTKARFAELIESVTGSAA